MVPMNTRLMKKWLLCGSGLSFPGKLSIDSRVWQGRLEYRELVFWSFQRKAVVCQSRADGTRIISQRLPKITASELSLLTNFYNKEKLKSAFSSLVGRYSLEVRSRRFMEIKADISAAIPLLLS